MIRQALALIRLLWRDDHPPTVLGGLRVLDLREDRHVDHDQVETAFSEAIEYLRNPDPDYFTLVQSNIGQIVISEASKESVVWWSRQLNTPLPARLRRNTLYLACRLVWAGSYFAALSQVPFVLRPLRRKAARHLAHETWVAFVGQFPNSEEWQSYLRAH